VVWRSSPSTAPLVLMQRKLLHRRSATSRCAGKGLKSSPLRLGPGAGRFRGIALWLYDHRHRADRRHHAAVVRGILGEGVALSEVLTLAHYRERSNIPTSYAPWLNTFGIGVLAAPSPSSACTALALSIHRWQSP